MTRDRRYPPKGMLVSSRYFEKETGDLIMTYVGPGKSARVRVPKEELSRPNWYNRKRKTVS